MFARVFSAILDGLEGEIVEIETGLLSGITSFSIVGLPDKAIQEAKERITLALKSIGAKPPLKFNRKTVVNLAPADIKKEGAYLDLGIAISFLSASKQINFSDLSKKILFLGELSLDGNLRKIKGALPIILSLERYFDEIYLPEENLNEIRFLKTNKVFLFKNLREVIDHIEGRERKEKFEPKEFYYEKRLEDLSFIKISDYILRALLIAASGRHNLLLFGPPGTGKTLIAKNLVNLLPNLSYEESLEVTSIYSASGEILDDFIYYPPFRNPHHSASPVSILGGGQNPKPGEVSLAHRGILFLDELPEFRRDILEGLREPLENGEITVARAKKTIKFPAKFLFIGAYNPCPCGYYGDPEKECVCSPSDIRRYRKKISGPILDRIDILINVPRIKGEDLLKEDLRDYKDIVEKIEEMKEIQLKRQGKYNSEISPKEIKKYCKLDEKAEDLLKKSIDRLKISIRSAHKIIKIAKTISDLEKKDIINQEHIGEALQYRTIEE
ncbi:MAG: YifB family Mg chelatase-like AAA ATPase [Minisyncoccia bacterium]